MDQSINGLMKAYLKDYEIDSRGDATDFEKFSNYCVFSAHQPYQSFNVDEVHTGNPGDTGIDGIGILVNNVLVNSEEEIEEEAGNRGRTLNVTFVFLQAKTEKEVDRDEILKTFEAITDFFADYHNKEPLFPRNYKIQDKARLSSYLLSKYSNQIRGKKLCKVYYISNSRRPINSTIEKLINSKKIKLKEECAFLDVSVFTWGCDDIEKVYRRTRLQVEAKAICQNIMPLSTSNSIQGIQQAYIATFKFSEFIKIITDRESGEIRSFIFYDNIRGFLGADNKVNSDIKETIESAKSNRFPILNNGVTIIAHEVRVEGLNEVIITDYQIVNGCQTSYVLYNSYNSKKISNIEEIVIPVKLIETDKDEIRNDIIKATNYQTEVQKELLLALSDFSKKLEEFYELRRKESNNDKDCFYYERRPGQYHADASIVKKRLIRIGDQLKTFAAMFIDLPHFARYKQQLIDEIGKTIFCEDHKQIPYYTSSLAEYKFEELVSKNIIPYEHKSDIKYHVLMVFKYITAGLICPKCNSKKIESYCQSIIDVLNNQQDCINIFQQAIDIVNTQAVAMNIGVEIDFQNFFKKSGFTNHLKNYLKVKNFNVSDLSKEQPKISPSIKSRKESKVPLMRIPKKNVDVTRTVNDLDEQLSLFPGLFPSHSRKHGNDQIDNYVEVPSALTQMQLAKRLEVRRETIGNKKHMKNFAEWTKERDPDHIAWNYSQQTKCYHPLDSEDA